MPFSVGHGPPGLPNAVPAPLSIPSQTVGYTDRILTVLTESDGTACVIHSTNASGQASFTLTNKPTSLTDYIVVFAFANGTSGAMSVSDSNSGSWSTANASSDTNHVTAGGCFYRQAVSADLTTAPTITLTIVGSNGNNTACAAALVHGGCSFDAISARINSYAASGSTTNLYSAAVTPAKAGDIALAFLGFQVSVSTTASTPANYALDSSVNLSTTNTPAAAVWYRVKTSSDASAESPQTTLTYASGSGGYYGVTILFSSPTTWLSSELAATTFVGGISKAYVSGGFSGVLTFSGSFVKSTVRSITSSGSFSGVVSKVTSAPLVAESLALSATVVRTVARGFTGSATFVGSSPSRVVRWARSGSVSSSGTMSKGTQDALVPATLSTSGSVIKSVRVVLAGVSSFAGSLSRRTVRGFTANGSFSGAVAKATSIPLVAATLSLASTTGKAVSRGLSGTLTFAGTQAKSVRKILAAASLTCSGVLTAVKSGGGHLYTQALTATLSSAETLSRSTARAFSGSLTPAGSSARMVQRGFTAAVSFVVTQAKATAHGLSGTFAPSGTLRRSTARAFTAGIHAVGAATTGRIHALSLTGSLLSAGAVGKSTAVVLAGAIGLRGQIGRGIAKAFAAVLSFVGDLVTFAPRSGRTIYTVAGIIDRTAIVSEPVDRVLTYAGITDRLAVVPQPVDHIVTLSASVDRALTVAAAVE